MGCAVIKLISIDARLFGIAEIYAHEHEITIKKDNKTLLLNNLGMDELVVIIKQVSK
jgi:hypothetical protein